MLIKSTCFTPRQPGAESFICPRDHCPGQSARLLPHRAASPRPTRRQLIARSSTTGFVHRLGNPDQQDWPRRWDHARITEGSKARHFGLYHDVDSDAMFVRSSASSASGASSREAIGPG
jgi:hypothetical protein